MPAPTPNECPVCNGPTKAIDVRKADGDVPGIRRRRECKADGCGYRFTTLEILCGPHPRAKEIAQWAAENNRDIFMREPES